MKNSNYVFIPRNRSTIDRIIRDCSTSDQWSVIDPVKRKQYTEFEAEAENGEGTERTREHVTIYQEDKKKHLPGKIQFTGWPNHGAFYKELDLKSDAEPADLYSKKAPTLAELNFTYSTAGSDEVGNGDILKPIIVTAAYVTPEHMADLIHLNVRDSKEVSSRNQMREIGTELTGITRFDKVQSGVVVKGEYLTYCTTILWNQDYDASQAKGERNKNDTMRRMHARVLNAINRECMPDYLFIDDFMNGDEKQYQQFTAMLEKESDRVFLRAKADSLNMAVSAASVISSYFGDLYLEQENQRLQEQYGLTKDFSLQPGANYKAKDFQKPLQRMQEAGVDLRKYMREHAKMSFRGVAELIEEIAKGK